MAVNTHTQVAAVSKIKMATAFLFLGGAALAASAAAGLAGRTPTNGSDLVIKSIILEPYVPSEDKGGGPFSGYDSYMITYENIGSQPVTKPFAIMIQSSPNPYMTWGGGDPVMYLGANNAVNGDGWSGGFPELVMKPAINVAGTKNYAIPVASATGESDAYPGLNKYALNGIKPTTLDGFSGGLIPGDIGQIRVYISKFYQDMLGRGGQAKIGAYVDYLKGNMKGVITEKNEQNNTKNVNFGKNNYAVVPSNLCGSDYIVPELAKDICKQQNGSFVCIDKYTQWYSACVPNATDCAKKIKTTVPCEVDLAGGQPYFDKVEVVMGGKDWQATKTFTDMSYALGKYSANKGEAITLYYPYEKMNENKIVRIKVTAKNATTANTYYGLYQEGIKNNSFGMYSPGDTASYSGFTNLFASNIVWGSSANSQFYTKSSMTTVYLGVKNNDATYFGFPNTKVADDAIVIQILPAPAPQPPTSTPTSTSGSGSNPPPTPVSTTISVSANAINPMTIVQGAHQLVGDYNFTATGGKTLCIMGVGSGVSVTPGNDAIKLEGLTIEDYTGMSSSFLSKTIGSFYKTYYNNYLKNYYDYESKIDPALCIESGQSRRLRFFIDEVSKSAPISDLVLEQAIGSIKFKNQSTGEVVITYPSAKNGPFLLP